MAGWDLKSGPIKEYAVTDDLLGRMWRYAQLGGLKEYAWEELKNA